MPRERSRLLAAFGSLTIVCDPMAVSVDWNRMMGLRSSTFTLIFSSQSGG